MACEVGNLHIVELLIGEVEDIDDLTLQGVYVFCRVFVMSVNHFV